jgi:hypothetical protein
MSQAAVEELMDMWLNDEAFREEVRKNPEAAIRARGYDLDEDEWSAVQSIDWDISDQELRERVSKSGVTPRAATE